MGEIKTNELKEVNKPVEENYLDIKPTSGMTPQEAKTSWDHEFNNIFDKQKAFETSKEKEFYDDNGKVYRKGNELAPNSEFIVNGYNYKTDEYGRTVSAEGTLRIRDNNHKRNMDSDEAVYNGEKVAGYEKGHLIGYQFGGSGGKENLSIMAGEVNHGDFYKLEKKMADALKDGADVKLKVELVYEEVSNKPSEYKVTFSINSEIEVTVIRNRNEGKYD